MQNTNVYDELADGIQKSDISDTEKGGMLKKLALLKDKKINILITGATGSGKSSTINALFETPKAKVGVGVDPETMTIEKYEMNNLILWDTPGFGDGKMADERHAKVIEKKLHEKDSKGNLLIDLVLVILDGSSRDLGTSYDLINNVIIPNLGSNKEKRILIGINQCDLAMKGRGWNKEKNKPEKELVNFLEQKVISVQKRIKEATGVDVTPIYYCAGYTDGIEIQRPYNLSKLLYYIIKFTPEEKRIAYVDNITQNKDNVKDDDRKQNYEKEIGRTLFESIKDGISDGSELGEEIGSIIGLGKVGKVVGGAIGAVGGFLSGLFGF